MIHMSGEFVLDVPSGHAKETWTRSDGREQSLLFGPAGRVNSQAGLDQPLAVSMTRQELLAAGWKPPVHA